MDEQKANPNASWSVAIIIICIIGFVATVYLMAKAMDAKFENVSQSIASIGRVDDVKVGMDALKTKLDVMDQKLDALKGGAAAAAAPAAAAPAAPAAAEATPPAAAPAPAAAAPAAGK